MVVSQGVEPHLSEEPWVTAKLPSVDIYLTMKWLCGPVTIRQLGVASCGVNGPVRYQFRSPHNVKLSCLRYPLQPIRRTGTMQREPRAGLATHISARRCIFQWLCIRHCASFKIFFRLSKSDAVSFDCCRKNNLGGLAFLCGAALLGLLL